MGSEWSSAMGSEWSSTMRSEWCSTMRSEWCSTMRSEWCSTMRSEWCSTMRSERSSDSEWSSVPCRLVWEEDGQVSREVWEKAGAAGLLGITTPAEAGGHGADFLHSAIAVEEQCYVRASGPGFSLHSDVVMPYFTNYGTKEQIERYVPDMTAGKKISAIAMTEPGAGSDLQGVKTRAVRDGDDWILNGSKTYITNGALCDVVLVVAVTDPDARARAHGISLFIVDAGTKGFNKGKKLKKLGLKAQDTSELFFEDVRLPKEALLGTELNKGFYQLMQELPQRIPTSQADSFLDIGSRDLFDASHDIFRASARKFFSEEVKPYHAQWEEDGQVSREVWEKAGAAGLLGIGTPAEAGGHGADFLHSAIAVEEQCYARASGPGFSLHSNVVMPYFTNYGTKEQIERYVPDMTAGKKISAIAMTEPGAGSDLQGVKTRAVRDGDDWILNGSKTYITNGTLCDVVLVVAVTDPDARARAHGISLFIVDAGTKGFNKGRKLKKLGLKAQDTSELFFEDVRLPKEALLGTELNKGFYQLMQELPQVMWFPNKTIDIR
ncbi:hypothetical protein HAZT_HAZT008135 [Hyalella azteca]|uniref:Acyl-CoA dehydrogenase n=1 Tax=Hyalella azteca TaxID=294128 RepID=A0A6A0HAR1_HYAAZ|nr:hypothetical protein HAZT_HAZT008135 [Hyalella azteca]